MSFGKIWVTAVLAAGLCGGMAMGQNQTEPPVQRARDASEPTLPLPRDKHGAAIEGACDVSLVVDEAGRPQKIHVVHCTDKRLKDYAEFSVAGYKFIPAKQNGRPVSAQTMIEISAHEPAKNAIANAASQNAAETSAGGAVHVADPPKLGPGTGTDDDPFNKYPWAEGVTPPKITYRPLAHFSDEARRKKEECTVGISLTVTKEGGVRDTLLVDSCPDLDENALKAVQIYRFQPAMKDGQPVAVRVTIKVGFMIR